LQAVSYLQIRGFTGQAYLQVSLGGIILQVGLIYLQINLIQLAALLNQLRDFSQWEISSSTAS
jgi:hypothetical protein